LWRVNGLFRPRVSRVSNDLQIKEKPEMKRMAFVVGTALLGLSTLTACGGGASAASSTPSPSPSATTAPSTPAAGGAALSTATVGNFGKIVVDGTGRTLYRYDADTASPSKSNCNGACATAWPPLLAGTGTVTRSDGTKQVTLAGWPLYYYANDAKAGDTTGQAVGGTWWVVAPSGQKITTKASSSGSSSGY
jgi:predicted lipoprotein with Yx(FWY)xxD motif